MSSAIRPMEQFVKTLLAARRVSTPLVAIRTADPALTVARIEEAVGKDAAIVQWDIVRGLVRVNDAGTKEIGKVLGDVLEVMGRHAGWMAAAGGLASGRQVSAARIGARKPRAACARCSNRRSGTNTRRSSCRRRASTTASRSGARTRPRWRACARANEH